MENRKGSRWRVSDNPPTPALYRVGSTLRGETQTAAACRRLADAVGRDSSQVGTASTELPAPYHLDRVLDINTRLSIIASDVHTLTQLIRSADQSQHVFDYL